MSLLSDIQADDNRFGFFDTDTFGESVTFRPYNAATRAIKVVIDRDAMPTPDEYERGIKEVMLVAVSNHATLGISSSVFNAGKDRIDLSYRPGETAKTYTLGMPVSIDSGQMTFRIK